MYTLISVTGSGHVKYMASTEKKDGAKTVPFGNLIIFHGLDTLQLTQEKEKCSVAQCSTGCFKNNF